MSLTNPQHNAHTGEGLDRAVARVRRGRHIRGESSLALGSFLPTQFETEHARPFRRLGHLIEIWSQTMPGRIVDRSRVVSFSRGVLNVAVDSSSTLYEADGLLRGGLEQAIRGQFRSGTLGRVRLSVDPSIAEDR